MDAAEAWRDGAGGVDMLRRESKVGAREAACDGKMAANLQHGVLLHLREVEEFGSELGRSGPVPISVGKPKQGTDGDQVARKPGKPFACPLPRLRGGIGGVHGAEKVEEAVLPVRLRSQAAYLGLEELACLLIVSADGGLVCLRAEGPGLLPTTGVFGQ